MEHFEYYKNGFKIFNFKNHKEIYYPITNGTHFYGSINPNLSGQLIASNRHMMLIPTSAVNQNDIIQGRHFFIVYKDRYMDLAGTSITQKLNLDHEICNVEYGLLYQTVERKNDYLTVTYTTFMPYGEKNIELTRVTIENTSMEPLEIQSFLSVPLYCRSETSLRDHRNVTSLLSRCKVLENGFLVKPTLSFDERGHNLNEMQYVCLSKEITFRNPSLEEFLETNPYDYPTALFSDSLKNYQPGDSLDGEEVNACLGYKSILLRPNEKKSYTFLLGCGENVDGFDSYLERFDEEFEKQKKIWQRELSSLEIHTSDPLFNPFMKYVTLQPVLRRIYGCSFLPHHDYGKGGRGWRDLWQDLLALILTNPEGIREQIINNFKGVRMDGSNATIIGTQPGEFKADRNNIPRVWSDHGVWPWFTTQLYMNYTGDQSILEEEIPYFQDENAWYLKKKISSDSTWVMTSENTLYTGSVLEHILIENLVSYFNVGSHNHLRLEGADWNDGLDMAAKNGETVAFEAFYANNFLTLGKYLCSKEGSMELQEDIYHLLFNEVADESILEKTDALHEYFQKVEQKISSKKITICYQEIGNKLMDYGTKMKKSILKSECIELDDSHALLNGYYNNDKNPMDGIYDGELHMNLTSQVFYFMEGDHKDLCQKVYNSVMKYLHNSEVPGIQLNTNYHSVLMNMGRLYGFAYGEKENGAIFSHMCVMYAYSLFCQGMDKEATDILLELYQASMNYNKSGIYPGLPEYFNLKGKGKYHYLTGSASWFVYVIFTRIYGIQAQLGSLIIDPHLVYEEFQEAELDFVFRGHKIHAKYCIEEKESISLNGEKLESNIISESKLKEVNELVVATIKK